MISARSYRRRKALLCALAASVLLHAILLSLLFPAIVHLFVPKGTPERVSQTTVVTIQRRAVTAPRPRTAHHVPRHRARVAPPAATPRHELAKQVAHAPPQPPRRPHPTVNSQIAHDQNGFAREVAQLNKQNDPHAIPTIDPGSRGPTMKSYSFDVASLNHGDEHGNGIITPTQGWHDRGLDCYYGRYEFTYPDGAMENGSIVWPFCYDPVSDPFKQPPHPMPFPLPPIGFRIPAGTQLPPIEKQIYDSWISGQPGGSASSR